MKVEICGDFVFIIDKDGKECVFNKRYMQYVAGVRGGEKTMFITLSGSDTNAVQVKFNMPILDFWNLYKMA